MYPMVTGTLTYYGSCLLLQVRHSIVEIEPGVESDLTHEDNAVFKLELDSQIVHWLNRHPDDWVLSWGGKAHNIQTNSTRS